MEEIVKAVDAESPGDTPAEKPGSPTEAPAAEVPVEVPAEEVPAEEVPAEEVPAEEVPAEEPASAEEERPLEAPREEQEEDQSAEALTLEKLSAIAESTGRLQLEVREMRKLYHNEFAGRLRSMQEELDKYHEIERGRMFDGILGEIARLYSDNCTLADRVEETKAQKQLRYLFLDMLQLLESNGVCAQKSNVGDKRNPRFCQVIERIPTSDPEKHDTVAQSRGIGFYIENRALIKEMVDVYIFDPQAE